MAGLERLAKRIADKDFPFLQWKEYEALNSEEKLAERFDELTALLDK